MQTTEGYALRKLKGSPEVLVTRVIRGSQHMISMKKQQQQQQDFLVTQEARLCSIATPNPPPPPTKHVYLPSYLPIFWCLLQSRRAFLSL